MSLVKPKTYNIADSNVANFGTKLEKDVKHAASMKEPAWDNAGKEVGIIVWRIEKFHVKPAAKETYGSFYSGDSYIVLQTYKKADKICWTIFFWLGDHTTQDEAGTAAYKTVELDDRLGGAATQSRETQGNESKAFLALFPKGIKTMEGGIETGFHHVGPTEYKPRLMHVRGVGKHVAAAQVDFSSKKFNNEDCFIVDLGLHIYQWSGSKANNMEKAKAAQLAHAMKDERSGKPDITIVEEGNDAAVPWEKLGGKPASFPAAVPAPKPQPAVLLKVGQKEPFAASKVATSPGLNLKMLTPGDVFIVDNSTEIFVWVGHSAPMAERKAALQVAADYVKKSGKPAGTAISRIVEHCETDEFIAIFD